MQTQRCHYIWEFNQEQCTGRVATGQPPYCCPDHIPVVPPSVLQEVVHGIKVMSFVFLVMFLIHEGSLAYSSIQPDLSAVGNFVILGKLFGTRTWLGIVQGFHFLISVACFSFDVMRCCVGVCPTLWCGIVHVICFVCYVMRCIVAVCPTVWWGVVQVVHFGCAVVCYVCPIISWCFGVLTGWGKVFCGLVVLYYLWRFVQFAVRTQLYVCVRFLSCYICRCFVDCFRWLFTFFCYYYNRFVHAEGAVHVPPPVAPHPPVM